MKIIDGLRETAKREYVSSFPIATIYLQLGDKNKAIEYLEKTYEERNTNSLFILKRTNNLMSCGPTQDS